MVTSKKIKIVLGMTLLGTACFAQQGIVGTETQSDERLYELVFAPKDYKITYGQSFDLSIEFEKVNFGFQTADSSSMKETMYTDRKWIYESEFEDNKLFRVFEVPNQTNHSGSGIEVSPIRLYTDIPHQPIVGLSFPAQEDEPFFRNRRNLYSSLWAFASLNYLYADLVGLMDKNKLLQYQTGVVDGVKITPEFLTMAAGFMQIPLANVFLPQVIKDERTLRWVQIASGAVMTLVQSGTLFVGKQAPYYILFSAFEIATTTFITIDAMKWKPNSAKRKFKGK